MQGRLAVLCLAAVLSVTTASAQTTQKTTTKKTSSTTTTTTTKKSAPPAKTEADTPRATPPPPPVVEEHKPAPAAPEFEPVPLVPEPRLDHLQAPGDIDARITLNADILLAFVNVGVGADVGVMKLGPGVLALGGEFEVGACVSFCLLLDALSGWKFSDLYLAPHVRASYHFLPAHTHSSGLEKVDLYGLVFAGLTIATTRVTGSANSADFEYVGSSVGPSLGLGVGGKYFIKDPFFLGAEARVRYSAGTYSYTARYGNVSLSDTESTWSLSGLNIQLFGGMRF